MMYVKAISLIFLTFQAAINTLMMRYCRTRTTELFFTSSLIVMSEVVKLIISFGIAVSEIGLRGIVKETVSDPVDSMKVAVPAVIYVIQNNLLYVALSNLDSATYQVTYQLKVLTTALFSVFMLKHKITKQQWVSLAFLFVGVAIVQLDPSDNTKGVAIGLQQNMKTGLMAVFTASLLSGFAGIYFEKTLKGSRKSLWSRNVLLALIGIVFSFSSQVIYEYREIQAKGYFYGFDMLVVILMFLNSAGGLLVAVVVKYANQVLKGFACSAAIVISILLSMLVFGTEVNSLFLIGTTLVIFSIVLYNKSSPTSVKKMD